jgi:glycine/D-amino acid oxidase-like deaminating enzyme
LSDFTAPRARLPKCVVVGAGVLGVTSAYRLAQAGVKVTLVDAGTAGGGTTGTSFAHVNASYAGYWDYVELRRAGVDGYHRLRKGPGGAPWWHDTGYLSVHRSGIQVAELDRHLIRLREIGYPADRFDEQPSAIEPALAQLKAERTFRFPSEGYVDLPAMLADLVDRARRLGAVVRTGDPVTALLTSGADVTGVRLRSGDTFPCDQLIICCGRWTDQVLGLAGLETRFLANDSAGGTPVAGLLVTTDAVDGSVNQVVSVDDINYRPDGEDRTMVWSGLVDRRLQEQGGRDADPDVPVRLAEELLSAASQHVPALVSARVHQATVAVRALPADGQPVVGRLPGIHGVYVALAHAAVTLAPVLADLVVAEVAQGRHDAQLGRFRPDRLIPTEAYWPDDQRDKEDVDDLAGKC